MATCPIPVGTLVRLTHDVERYPHFVARQGLVGTVISNRPDLDLFEVGGFRERIIGAEEWGNAILWSNDDDPMDDLEVLPCQVDPDLIRVREAADRIGWDKVFTVDGEVVDLDSFLYTLTEFLPDMDLDDIVTLGIGNSLVYQGGRLGEPVTLRREA